MSLQLSQSPPAPPSGSTAGEEAARVAGIIGVVGVAGGVGTSTVAAAIGGRDLGVFAGRPADVVVCRSTVASVLRAGRVAALGGRPVVAVTAVDATRPSRAVSARLRLLEPHTTAVVLLPHVPGWRDAVAPLDEVRDQLACPAEAQPRAVRDFLAAISAVRAGLRAAGDPNRTTTELDTGPGPGPAAGWAVRA